MCVGLCEYCPGLDGLVSLGTQESCFCWLGLRSFWQVSGSHLLSLIAVSGSFGSVCFACDDLESFPWLLRFALCLLSVGRWEKVCGHFPSFDASLSLVTSPCINDIVSCPALPRLELVVVTKGGSVVTGIVCASPVITSPGFFPVPGFPQNTTVTLLGFPVIFPCPSIPLNFPAFGAGGR